MQPSADEEQQTLGAFTSLRERYQKELEDEKREEEQKNQEEEEEKRRKAETHKKREDAHEAQKNGRQEQPDNIQAEARKRKTGLIIGIVATVVLTIVMLALWPRLRDQSPVREPDNREMLQTEWISESEKQDDRKKIDIMVVHGDGKKTYYTFKTDSENLRGALEEKQLIEGESSEYGLFVRTVDGETADEAKQQWWNITKGGKPIETGIDNVVIADGDSYELTLITGW